jgi:hypothetical protein
MNTRDILIEARKLIEKPEDWNGGGFCKGKHCAQTAISSVASRSRSALELEKSAISTFATAADIKFETSASPIWVWNDASSRTHADVLAAFDRAIADAR